MLTYQGPDIIPTDMHYYNETLRDQALRKSESRHTPSKSIIAEDRQLKLMLESSESSSEDQGWDRRHTTLVDFDEPASDEPAFAEPIAIDFALLHPYERLFHEGRARSRSERLPTTVREAENRSPSPNDIDNSTSPDSGLKRRGRDRFDLWESDKMGEDDQDIT